MNKYYKLTITSSGGEYAFGVITDDDEIDTLKEKIDDGEVIHTENNWDDTDIEINMYEYTQVLGVYGPNISSLDNVVFDIEVYSDIDCEILINDASQYQLRLNNIKCFTSSNPWLSDDIKGEYSENCLFFGGYKIDKNIAYSVLIELDENENFKLENLFLGSMNMDETLSNDEILDTVMYINELNQKKILDLYFDGEENENNSTLDDVISEISEEESESRKVLYSYTLEVLENEGTESSGDEYTRVLDMSENILYE